MYNKDVIHLFILKLSSVHKIAVIKGAGAGVGAAAASGVVVPQLNAYH